MTLNALLSIVLTSGISATIAVIITTINRHLIGGRIERQDEKIRRMEDEKLCVIDERLTKATAARKEIYASFDAVVRKADCTQKHLQVEKMAAAITQSATKLEGVATRVEGVCEDMRRQQIEFGRLAESLANTQGRIEARGQ